jgi:phosphoglycerol transferase MdoB-like AlkP superfamily enzyme
LLNQSCYFKNGIANGKQSIEAMPAIFASIPNLMATPYILSSFCNNKLNALPSILKTKGYTSAFFHGAKNGSMRFDSFSKKLGFDTYFGMNEYPIKSHYDGLWGIPDGYFNPWALSKINKMKEPFLASIFTISSHHPYKIPIKLEHKISKNLTKEQQSFYYADQSLCLFFKHAQKFPWFKNTIFVICADHTPQQLDGKSATNFEKFNIPIAFYTPDKSILPEKNLAYFQQIDILPYLLKELGITTQYYAFGNDSHQSGGLVYLNGNYLFLENQGELIFNEIEKTATYIDKTKGKRILIENKTLTLGDKQLLLLVKSVIERYRNDLRNNKTSIK